MTRTVISTFLGLHQDGDGVGGDLRYAREAINVTTAGGMLAAAARPSCLLSSLDAPIGTLARLHRRWHAENDERDVLVAASGGRLYWMLPEGGVWAQIDVPEGWIGDSFSSDSWSWVAYETNYEIDGETPTEAPVDVLLLSNALDGMICVRGDDMTASVVHTPKKFGVIARYAERIWGGAIPNDPDMLVYSAPFDPFNWAQNDEIPEDGAGDIQQPSWDGDSFTALIPFGAQLLAMKRGRVWRILGTDPGQYAFREQFGGGAMFARTVAVDGERALMLGEDGALCYDGLSVAPFGQAFARGVFRRMNKSALSGVCACVYRGAYYLALPLDGAADNNAVLIHDFETQTWLLREGVRVLAFLPTDAGLFFTESTRPGRVWRWGEDAFRNGAASPCRWVSPWIDLADMGVRKGGWIVRLFPEGEPGAELAITIRTERTARTKRMRVGKPRALCFGGMGRRFRFEIDSDGASPWRLPGGIEIDTETNPD